MTTRAVVFERPGELALRDLVLEASGDPEVLVEVEWTGISTGTERLLFTGRMPPFPGLAYPLVPGYETVGRVVEAPEGATVSAGDRVFVPGASCFRDVRGLFGGAASRLRVAPGRVTRIDDDLGADGVLLALAATAHHAVVDATPELIVGHGALGRLAARLTVAAGGRPTVWEKDRTRMAGGVGYDVVDPDTDERRDYRSILDVSGDPKLLDTLIGRLAKGGEITLGGFYADRLSFAFPLAFMKEARFRVAAEWTPQDLDAVLGLLGRGALDLRGLITHQRPFDQASEAYGTAFSDPGCLKMILDWSGCE